FAIGMMPVMGFVAAALATSVSGWTMVWQLWRGSRGMDDSARFDDRFKQRLPRIILASLAMGVVLWGLTVLLGPALDVARWRWMALGVLVGGGMLSYFGAGTLFGAFRLAEFKALMRRRRDTDAG
ncbi:MAG: lipid II flippase MurJ, partial [Gemmobacter sp.]